MTVTEDFFPDEEGEKFPAAPNYPTAFGVTLTPAVSGALIAVLGLAGSIYLILNLLMPVWQQHQELQASRTQKQAQVDQKAALLSQIEQLRVDLAQAKQQKADVTALFASEQTLDTLLLDINRVVESSNARIEGNNARARLRRFVPVNQSAEVIADGSLGPEVNGKLKRRTINLELEGTFEQTQSIIRNIERLQPLLIVRDYQSTLTQASTSNQPKSVRGPVTITTSFQLQALMPVE